MAKKRLKPDNIKPLETLQVEYVPIDWLRPNEYNPNRQSDHEFELLKQSIEQDGYTQPILCLPDGRIVDGEHRWRACKALGYDQIAVVKADMDDTQRRIATLRHNLARGSHDVELSANVLRDLESLGALDWAQQALQLDDIEIQRLLETTTPIEAYSDHEFGQSWEYTEAAQQDSNSSNSSTVQTVMQAIQEKRNLEELGMKKEDAQLVKRNFTFTSQQEQVVREAVGSTPADTILAMAEAHVDAKKRASRGEWTTLTFVVPTQALLLIEQELDRLHQIAPNRNTNLTPELQRGLALEYMAVLSSQTDVEELQD